MRLISLHLLLLESVREFLHVPEQKIAQFGNYSGASISLLPTSRHLWDPTVIAKNGPVTDTGMVDAFIAVALNLY